MGEIECKVALVAAFAMMGAASLGLAAPAARVEFAVGNAEVISAGGQPRALQKGAPIEPGDTVATNAGRVQLRFSDGASVSLQPGSQFRVDEYRWDGKADGSERGFFSLLKGGLRTITGVVGRGNKRNYQVNTSVATIGIRGTEYKIAQFGDGIVGSVGEGAINVCNGAGCAPFTSGETFLVTNRQSEPALTDKQVDLPPVQPGDPAGGSFQTANDSTKNPGSSPLISGDQTTPSGAPVGLILTGQQTLAGVYRSPSSPILAPAFTGETVLLDNAGAVVQLPATQGLTIDSAGLLPGNIFGNDGVSAWGAFKDTTGAVAHYAVGLPVSIAPKIATYALISPEMATRPTDALGNPIGTLTSWNQTVNFYGLATGSATWNVQGTTLSVPLNGGFDGPLYLAGSCEVGSCNVNAQGLPYGPGARRFGMAYHLDYTPAATPQNLQPASVSAQGAAMLTQTSAQ